MCTIFNEENFDIKVENCRGKARSQILIQKLSADLNQYKLSKNRPSLCENSIDDCSKNLKIRYFIEIIIKMHPSFIPFCPLNWKVKRRTFSKAMNRRLTISHKNNNNMNNKQKMVQLDIREPSPLFLIHFISRIFLCSAEKRIRKLFSSKKMSRFWPSSIALFSILLISIQQTLACVDILFVIDNKTLEVSRSRAIQVAKELPEDQKIRKWVVLSRNDRYVPRVLRNNAELQTVLNTIHGDYDRFLEIATGEIARRTATFQPFVILLFSETPVNQTMTNMWRNISLAPALHIYRIGSLQRSTKMLSEDQEMDFEKLIECGRNQSSLFGFDSSKFHGGNEIRRSPTSTHRPWTSTRGPFVRRLTFYDASQALINQKKKEELSKVDTKFTITRTFKKMTTIPMSTTRRMTTTTIRPKTTKKYLSRSTSKYDAKKTTRSYQTTTR